MDLRISAFLDLTRANVKFSDLNEFCPNDPGHPEYVRILDSVLRTGKVSVKESWYLSDAFFWMKEEPRMDLETKDRIRNYRLFLNSIALGVFAAIDTVLPIHPYNYVCYHLVNDAKHLDSKSVRVLREAFDPVREILKEADVSEFIFFRFGEVVIRQLLDDIEGSETAAKKLLQDENDMVENRAMDTERLDSRFMVGATNYGDKRKEWIQMGIDLKNPNNNASISTITEMLATGGWPSN